jgi:Ca-activated chloride channel family protein
VKISAPEKPGEYEVRYILGQGDTIIAAQKVTVGASTASVTAPAQIAAGAKLSVSWQGPANPRDYLTVVKADAAEQTWGRYEYVTRGNPITLVAPDAPGEYEVRYLTGQNNTTLARARVTVGPVTGAITGPAQVTAGDTFKVSWRGPDNPRNFITVVKKDAREGAYSSSYAYTDPRNNPLNLFAPLEPGDYELRYRRPSLTTPSRAPRSRSCPASRSPARSR